MLLKRALLCQEKLQSVMTNERLNLIILSAPLQSGSSSAYSTEVHLQSQNSSACFMMQLDFEEPAIFRPVISI